ncbi:MAG TPA: hypothetical protein PKI89_07770 [Tepidiformaceae bacterium]|nr:hypothetical protein [Tepidiformaceae bacterium]HNO65000.1 hypothetical protein [Tepidiformaceae bacterium]
MTEDVTVVCAWCNERVSGTGPLISHGICVSCAESFIARLPREYLRSIAEPDGTVTLFSGHRLVIPADDCAK